MTEKEINTKADIVMSYKYNEGRDYLLELYDDFFDKHWRNKFENLRELGFMREDILEHIKKGKHEFGENITNELLENLKFIDEMETTERLYDIFIKDAYGWDLFVINDKPIKVLEEDKK